MGIELVTNNNFLSFLSVIFSLFNRVEIRKHENSGKKKAHSTMCFLV